MTSTPRATAGEAVSPKPPPSASRFRASTSSECPNTAAVIQLASSALGCVSRPDHQHIHRHPAHTHTRLRNLPPLAASSPCAPAWSFVGVCVTWGGLKDGGGLWCLVCALCVAGIGELLRGGKSEAVLCRAGRLRDGHQLVCLLCRWRHGRGQSMRQVCVPKS